MKCEHNIRRVMILLLFGKGGVALPKKRAKAQICD